MTGEMEGPAVKVQLQAADHSGNFDRTFILDKDNSTMFVSRASQSHGKSTTAQENNCYIESAIISRNHAKFIMGDRKFPLKIVDQGSTHGTMVDSTKLTSGQVISLRNGSTISFGRKVSNGIAEHLPTIFLLDFTWVDPPPRLLAMPPALTWRAPTPLQDYSESDHSEEEDEDEVEDMDKDQPHKIQKEAAETADMKRQQSCNSGKVISSTLSKTVTIDLTRDSSASPEAQEDHRDSPTCAAHNTLNHHPHIHNQVVTQESSVIKETNLDNLTRRYRFDYGDSDLEEGQDTACVSRSLQEDFDSLYDASIASDYGSDPEHDVTDAEMSELSGSDSDAEISEYNTDVQLSEYDSDAELSETTEVIEGIQSGYLGSGSSNNSRILNQIFESRDTITAGTPQIANANPQHDKPGTNAAVNDQDNKAHLPTRQENVALKEHDGHESECDSPDCGRHEAHLTALNQAGNGIAMESALRLLGASRDDSDRDLISKAIALNDGRLARRIVGIVANHRGSSALMYWLVTGGILGLDKEEVPATPDPRWKSTPSESASQDLDEVHSSRLPLEEDDEAERYVPPADALSPPSMLPSPTLHRASSPVYTPPSSHFPDSFFPQSPTYSPGSPDVDEADHDRPISTNEPLCSVRPACREPSSSEEPDWRSTPVRESINEDPHYDTNGPGDKKTLLAACENPFDWEKVNRADLQSIPAVNSGKPEFISDKTALCPASMAVAPTSFGTRSSAMSISNLVNTAADLSSTALVPDRATSPLVEQEVSQYNDGPFKPASPARFVVSSTNYRYYSTAVKAANVDADSATGSTCSSGATARKRKWQEFAQDLDDDDASMMKEEVPQLESSATPTSPTDEGVQADVRQPSILPSVSSINNEDSSENDKQPIPRQANIECSPSPSKKVKIQQPSSTAGGFKTFASHCLAGAIGAAGTIGAFALFAATTPAAIQQAQLFNNL